MSPPEETISSLLLQVPACALKASLSTCVTMCACVCNWVRTWLKMYRWCTYVFSCVLYVPSCMFLYKVYRVDICACECFPVCDYMCMYIYLCLCMSMCAQHISLSLRLPTSTWSLQVTLAWVPFVVGKQTD